MAEGECHGDCLWISISRESPRVTDEVDDLVRNVQLLKQHRQKARRPFHRDMPRSKFAQDRRTNTRAPSHQV